LSWPTIQALETMINHSITARGEGLERAHWSFLSDFQQSFQMMRA
jgi:hypothetical protein